MRPRSRSVSSLASSLSAAGHRQPAQWPLVRGNTRTRARCLTTTTPRRNGNRNNHNNNSTHFNRSDFGNQPFTGIYEPGGPTAGPLGGASNVGAPTITPRMLKSYLDEFVVGQERAKKVLSTAVYNHYQRVQELQRQEDEYEEQQQQRARREHANRHPVEGTWYPVRDTVVEHDENSSFRSYPTRVVENRSSRPSREHVLMDAVADEFPGQQQTYQQHEPKRERLSTRTKFEDSQPSLNIEKSNILLLGPSGVGKTLMAKTLARILDVPFSMSDCTPLTQAGYIGEDVDVVVQRLLAAANYDVAKAENGIICLDEIDKIATARVSHGKDVSGEGVQQALLKMIEGTTVTVSGKNEKTSPATGRERDRSNGSPGYPSSIPMGGMPGGGGSGSNGKNEVYTVRTDNILFICTGAFIGLHKHVMDRIAKGSIGFNAPIRAANPDPSKGIHDTTIKVDSSNVDLLREHLPFWHTGSLPSDQSTQYTHSSTAPLPSANSARDADEDPTLLNTLDLITPTDLQKFGLIPELVGRIPVHCAVSPLSEHALVRVLTEPKNALLKQYEALFALSGIELRFTSGAVREVARKAVGLGTGARGLRGVLEGVLAESMFDGPGSSTKYILVTQDVVLRKAMPVHLARGQGQLFQSLWVQEEERWKEEQQQMQLEKESGYDDFREWRTKVSATGS